MPAADLVQKVRAAIDKNKAIPAQLDAYGEFVDSPIGKLELDHLYEVFSTMLGNLTQRFPDMASKRAATNTETDISSFLVLANNDPERVKDVLKKELRSVLSTMSASISERFSRMNNDEKKAIDATLRLIRRSTVDLIFRVESGKQLSSAGPEFRRFFAVVKAESSNIRELRYENLIVEKGIFNKLLLKSEKQDFTIWVPSFFAKESLDSLIERVAPISEHLLMSHLKDLKRLGKIEALRPFLSELMENSGVLGKGTPVPEDLSAFMHEVANEGYFAMAPIDLDDIYAFGREEELERREKELQIAQEERLRQEAVRKEKEQRIQPRPIRTEVLIRTQTSAQATVSIQEGGIDSIHIGKLLDLDQFIKALGTRVGEKDFPSEVRETRNSYLPFNLVRKHGLAIVGSSGSGRSATLKRVIDGIATKGGPGLMVLDQKGEHRGIAWKHKWKTFAFVGDSQAKELSVPLVATSNGNSTDEDADLIADLLQEWFLQIGVNCSDQNRARISSILKASLETKEGITPQSIALSLSKEPELNQLSQKFSKSFAYNATVSRIFSNSHELQYGGEGSALFDISGRGLKDPTTKEERILVSVLLLRSFLRRGIKGVTIVIEDVLDRFKSESLRKKCLALVGSLKSDGNTIIATSRSQIRDFVGAGCVEILHRLSGEKVVNEELAGFRAAGLPRNLETLIGFLPRGYAIISQIEEDDGRIIPPQAIRVEQLQFGTSPSS